MLLRNAISKAKKLFHKSITTLPSKASRPRYPVATRNSPKPLLSTPSLAENHGSTRVLRSSTTLLPMETEHDKHMEMMKKNKQPINKSTTSEDAYGGSFMKFGKQPMKMDQKRKEIVKEEEGDGYCSEVLRMEASFRFEQKLKELELMDMSNVEHVLDIEEVLHYYSRHTCPFYVDIVNKFFTDVYSEFMA